MIGQNEIDKEEIYLELADKHNIPYIEAKKIIDHQFKSLANHMHELKEEPFKLMYLGKVYLKYKKGLEDEI